MGLCPQRNLSVQKKRGIAQEPSAQRDTNILYHTQIADHAGKFYYNAFCNVVLYYNEDIELRIAAQISHISRKFLDFLIKIEQIIIANLKRLETHKTWDRYVQDMHKRNIYKN